MGIPVKMLFVRFFLGGVTTQRWCAFLGNESKRLDSKLHFY